MLIHHIIRGASVARSTHLQHHSPHHCGWCASVWNRRTGLAIWSESRSGQDGLLADKRTSDWAAFHLSPAVSTAAFVPKTWQQAKYTHQLSWRKSVIKFKTFRRHTLGRSGDRWRRDSNGVDAYFSPKSSSGESLKFRFWTSPTASLHRQSLHIYTSRLQVFGLTANCTKRRASQRNKPGHPLKGEKQQQVQHTSS